MKQTIIIDWLRDVVEPWFNSQNHEGGFITSVTNYNLFNNLTDIDVIAVYADGSFQRPPLKREVRKWFRNRIKKLVKQTADIERRILVVNGCTPQQDIGGGMTWRLKQYVNKDKDHWTADENDLLRLTGRFKAHFVNESPTILFPEPFFNVYIDELWEYCSVYTATHLPEVTFVDNHGFSYGAVVRMVGDYFPQGSVQPCQMLDEKDGDDAGLVVIRDTMDFFDRLFSDAGVGLAAADDMQKAITDNAVSKFKESLAKAI